MSVKKDPKSNVWIAQVGSGSSGTRKKKSFRLKKDAEAWENEQVTQRRCQSFSHYCPEMLIEHAKLEFEKSHTTQTKKTITHVMSDIKAFCTTMQVKHIGDFSSEMLLSYSRLDHPKAGAYTIGKKLKHVKGFLRFISKNGWAKYPNLDDVKTELGEKRKPKPLNLSETQRFLRTVKKNSEYCWFPIALFFVYTGLRRKELVCLEWSDIDLTERIVLVRPKPDIIIDGDPCNLKTKESERVIPLNQILCDLLVDMKSRRRSEFVFSNQSGNHMFANFNRDFKIAIEGHNIPRHITPHCLRHTFISQMISYSNEDLFTVKELAGHSSIQTTQLYVGLLDADRKKRGAVDNLPKYEL